MKTVLEKSLISPPSFAKSVNMRKEAEYYQLPIYIDIISPKVGLELYNLTLTALRKNQSLNKVVGAMPIQYYESVDFKQDGWIYNISFSGNELPKKYYQEKDTSPQWREERIRISKVKMVDCLLRDEIIGHESMVIIKGRNLLNKNKKPYAACRFTSYVPNFRYDKNLRQIRSAHFENNGPSAISPIRAFLRELTPDMQMPVVNVVW